MKRINLDKDWLIEQYINKDKSISDIGKEFNLNVATIYNYLIFHNIKPRSRKTEAKRKSILKRRTGKIIKCDYCNLKLYRPKNRIKRNKYNFCSFECLGKWRRNKPLSDSHKLKIKQNNCKYWLGKIRDEKTMLKLINSSASTSDTNIERIIENQLLFNDILYVKQFYYKLGIADFWLPESNIIIECDGDYWHSSEKSKLKDKIQTEYLEENGFIVYRFLGSEIMKNTKQILAILFK